MISELQHNESYNVIEGKVSGEETPLPWIGLIGAFEVIEIGRKSMSC